MELGTTELNAADKGPPPKGERKKKCVFIKGSDWAESSIPTLPQALARIDFSLQKGVSQWYWHIPDRCGRLASFMDRDYRREHFFKYDANQSTSGAMKN